MAILKVWTDTKNTGRCRSCQARVTWFEFVSSRKRHPFSGDPTFVRTEHDDATGRLIGHIDSSIDKSHFADCPQAESWRKKA